MSILSRLLGTFQTTFQIGKGGPKVKAPSTTTVALVAADGSTEVQGQFLSARINNQATVLGSGGALQVKDSAGTNEAQVQALSARINNQATVTAAAGAVTVKDAAGSANAKVFAADPLTTDTQGLLTVNFYNNNAPASANTIKALTIKSGNYALTYTTAVVLPKANTVTRCVVVVTTPLDVATTLSVGTDEAGQDARFMLTGENDITAAGTYEVSPFQSVGSATDQSLRVTLDGTPTVGTVAVFVEYVVPTAW